MRLLMIATIAACGPAFALSASEAMSPPQPITVDAIPISLDTHDPEINAVGRLSYRGGLQLTSPDPRFGGLSGWRVSADGQAFIAVSDHGYLLHGRLVYDNADNLAGMREVTLTSLVEQPSAAHLRINDAEALEILPGGELLIAFEGQHRIISYPADGTPPRPFPAPAGLEDAPPNGGLEALVALANGSLLAVTEQQATAAGVKGWIWAGQSWQPLVYETSEGFRPTDAARLPSGDIIFVERIFPPPAIRLRIVPRQSIVAGATLHGDVIAQFTGSLNYDNMEGIDARLSPSGETLIYIVSDNNYLALQRTLLLMFQLRPAG